MASLTALIAPQASPPQGATETVQGATETARDASSRTLAVQVAANPAPQGPIMPQVALPPPNKAAGTVTLPDAPPPSDPPRPLAVAPAAEPTPQAPPTPGGTYAAAPSDPGLTKSDPSAQRSEPQPTSKPASSPSAVPATSHAATAAAEADSKSPAQSTTAAASTTAVPANAGVTADGGQSSDMQDGRSRRDGGAAFAPTDAAAKTDAAAPGAAIDQPQTVQASTAAAQARATPQTVAHLAAQIVSKAGSAKATQFDVALDPQGLGRVNVSLRIASDGTLSAAMAFDTPQAAAELRARSDELQRALAQAGFNVADGALSFDVSGDRGRQSGRQSAWANLDFGADAFSSPLSLSTDTAPSAAQLISALRASRSGVDIRI